MPMPKRASPDDYYEQLSATARPHLLRMRELCREELPDAREQLAWNTGAFVQDGVRLVMLQAFSKHASLRFSPEFFATVSDHVTAVGYAVGAGFIKLPFDQPLPEDLLRELLRSRLTALEATGR